MLCFSDSTRALPKIPLSGRIAHSHVEAEQAQTQASKASHPPLSPAAVATAHPCHPGPISHTQRTTDTFENPDTERLHASGAHLLKSLRAALHLTISAPPSHTRRCHTDGAPARESPRSHAAASPLKLRVLIARSHTAASGRSGRCTRPGRSPRPWPSALASQEPAAAPP